MSDRKPNPRFFDRDPGGSVRLRIRLTPKEASLIEEAAGKVPLVQWMVETVSSTAQKKVEALRGQWPTDPPNQDIEGSE